MRQATCLKDEGNILFFSSTFQFFLNLLFGWSYLSLTVTEDCLREKKIL